MLLKQRSDYGISYVFNFLKSYSIAASETLRLVVLVMVSCRWSFLLIFLVIFIIVEMLLSMQINIIFRVVCSHRIIESIARSKMLGETFVVFVAVLVPRDIVPMPESFVELLSITIYWPSRTRIES